MIAWMTIYAGMLDIINTLPPGSYAYECMHASVYMYVLSKQQGQQRNQLTSVKTWLG